RALAIEGGFVGAGGGRTVAQAERTVALARDAARGLDDPYSDAMVLTSEGLALCFSFQFAAAVERFERAIAIFREKCPGSAWETTTATFFLFVCQWYACRLHALRDGHEAALKDAVERGDRYAAVMYRIGPLNRRRLAARPA